MDDRALPGTAADLRDKARRSRDLESLRWNWEVAYDIDVSGHRGREAWTAVRTDGAGLLSAPSAAELRARILADYTARPVVRDA